MKKIILLIILGLFLTGCGMTVTRPWGVITQNTDSQIFVYTDSDVVKSKSQTKTDDTTIIIVGVKDGQDLKSIFNHAMDKISEIFKARGKVYNAWVVKK